jgi:hypothetical protein
MDWINEILAQLSEGDGASPVHTEISDPACFSVIGPPLGQHDRMY